MVGFQHLRHPDGRGGVVPCASCHTHGPDSLQLAAGTAACALCHSAAISGRSDSGCTMCHPNPRHTRSTSQGVQLPHATLQNARVPCTRCHYRLSSGTTSVSPNRCASCHQPREVARTGQLSADSSHAAHRDIACTTCHERITHRVVAMSAAVNLECLTCHSLLHSPSVPAADSAPDSSCGNCHRGVHAEEQRLVLGLLPGDSMRPSSMFMGGVTCRSCHITANRPAPPPGRSLRGTPAACTGCHGGAWNDILGRWRRGYARRRAMIAGYLNAADSSLGPHAAPAARASLNEARGLLDFVDRAGPLHNLPISDRLMRRTLALASQAYRASGRTPPPPPSLGPPVLEGTCLSCHYGVEEAPLALDSAAGRRSTHADHLFRGGLPCETCHAVGAEPPGFAGREWDGRKRQ